MPVQSIAFPINEWTKPSSKKWLEKHNYRPKKSAHLTPNFIRYRLIEPSPHFNYSTIVLSNGIHLTLIN